MQVSVKDEPSGLRRVGSYLWDDWARIRERSNEPTVSAASPMEIDA